MKLLVPFSLFLIFLSTSCCPDPTIHEKEVTWLTPEGKFINGKIDLYMDRPETGVTDGAGLILVELGDDLLRYVIYQDFISVNTDDKVYFQIEFRDGLPIARNITKDTTGLTITDIKNLNLENQLTIKFHNFGFTHGENDSQHNKIHRIKLIETDTDDASRVNKDRILFTGFTNVAGKEKKVVFAVNVSDRTPIKDGDEMFYLTQTILEDSIVLVKLSKEHYHEN